MNIEWFDIVVAALMLIIGIKGVFNGFIKEASGLIGIVLGVWVASTYSSSAGDWLGANLFSSIDSTSALHMIGFLSLLFTVWLFCLIVGALLSKKITFSHFGMLDNILGFLFAAAKLFIVLSIIIYALASIEVAHKKLETILGRSVVYPYMIKTGSYLFHINSHKIKATSAHLKNTVVKTLSQSAEKIFPGQGLKGYGTDGNYK